MQAPETIIRIVYRPMLAAPRLSILIYAALIVGTLLIPFIGDTYVLEILANSFFYIVLCLGLNIVVGYAGLLDLGYAAFFAVGAYTTGILTSHYGWNFWLTIPAALVFSIIAGVIIGGPTLRLRSDYLAIVTLVFGEITRITARNLKDISGGPSGLIGISRPSFFGLELNQIQHYYYAFLSWSSWRFSSATGSSIPAWAGPGSMCARTRTPPKPWASTA